MASYRERGTAGKWGRRPHQRSANHTRWPQERWVCCGVGGWGGQSLIANCIVFHCAVYSSCTVCSPQFVHLELHLLCMHLMFLHSTLCIGVCIVHCESGESWPQGNHNADIRVLSLPQYHNTAIPQYWDRTELGVATTLWELLMNTGEPQCRYRGASVTTLIHCWTTFTHWPECNLELLLSEFDNPQEHLNRTIMIQDTRIQWLHCQLQFNAVQKFERDRYCSQACAQYTQNSYCNDPECSVKVSITEHIYFSKNQWVNLKNSVHNHVNEKVHSCGYETKYAAWLATA